jgi:Domain of unknown function (DUF4928)
MTGDLTFTLQEFTKDRKFNRKGPLSVALVVTQQARNMGLPLDPEKLLTEGGGQVLGLGKSAVQAILHRHGIERVLAAEGGRTSRGSISNMREYVTLLNRIHGDGHADLQAIEAFWVAHVQEFFAAKPFRVRLDASSSLRLVVRDILEQAEERQKAALGVWYVGAVMQHMVGAKLDCALGPGKFQHNSFTTSDEQSGRKGDFFVGDVAIHVTTSPGEAAIQRCSDNLNDGHRPILVTRQRGLTVAEALAENVGLGDRIDIFEIEQFIALNLYEMGKFVMEGRRAVLKDFVTRYNEIIDEVETDPSLRIELRV